MFVPGLVDPIDWTMEIAEENPTITAIVAAGLAHPKTRAATGRFLWEVGSLLVKETVRFNIRVGAGLSRVAYSRIAPIAARIAASQTAARIATGVRVGGAAAATGATFAAAATAGAILGAAAGMGISYTIWGEDGYEKAHDFYTGDVGIGEYFSTLKAGFWDSW